ncbi:MAG: 2-succinyl-5-enolpyruvyl-6-hydroxy-3-cyclohexene-1-carboxylic-acid synthase [Deltaproteobacteria bacterium]|nr:2-succinyl-5-enolpyruvyl-6-hydroxy-3-cyclohexene-1-carboxylic-acid synthase [Deltaproteobacteria bacterium]
MYSPLASGGANFAFAARLIGDLSAGGAGDAVLCPGSRSAPLAAVAATTPGLRVFPQLDERSAAYFALGLCRARRAPVLLICTSGTAAANFAPAVAEASLSRAPLLLLCADRPPEMRGWGAAQTIDQVQLFGSHVRWFAEAPAPCESQPQLALARALAERALHESQSRIPGPVHLNLPFCEPLHPAARAAASANGAPAPAAAPVPALAAAPARSTAGAGAVDGALAEQFAARFAEAQRPVIVAGPWEAREESARAVCDFAQQLCAPLLAEPLSQLRAGDFVSATPLVAAADAILRSDSCAAALAPDLVLRIGAAPTSRAIHRWLDLHASAELIALDEHGGRRDPQHRVDWWIEAEPAALLAAAPRASRSEARGWCARWRAAEQRAWAALRDAEPGGALLPPAIVRAALAALPENGVLALANSLAVRDAESFAPPQRRALRFLCNRGANGIDGTISTALGAAASGAEVALLCGDLAFLHDVGALFTAQRSALRCTIIIVNDGGGGIFDHLPIAAQKEAVRFEECFRLAHNLSLTPLARAFGCSAVQVQNESELRAALANAAPGLRIIEARIAAEENARFHRAAFAAVAQALEPAP